MAAFAAEIPRIVVATEEQAASLAALGAGRIHVAASADPAVLGPLVARSLPVAAHERTRVVQLAVRGICDDADDFNVTTLRSGDPNLPAHRVACREQCASQGRRDQRNGGLLQAVIRLVALEPLGVG